MIYYWYYGGPYVVNRTYGRHKAYMFTYCIFAINNNIWSYLLWPPVIPSGRCTVLPCYCCIIEYIYTSRYERSCFIPRNHIIPYHYVLLLQQWVPHHLILWSHGRTPPVARNPHKQHVLDAKFPFGSMIWRCFTLTSSLNRFSESRLTPSKRNRFYPVFVFRITPRYPVFVFFNSLKVPTSSRIQYDGIALHCCLLCLLHPRTGTWYQRITINTAVS